MKQALQRIQNAISEELERAGIKTDYDVEEKEKENGVE